MFVTLQALPDYSTFVELLLIAGYNADTEVIGPFTVFAPTNAAFAQLPAGALDTLRADPGLLNALLGYHVVAGRLSAAELSGALDTINGSFLLVEGSGASLTVGGAPVVEPDIAASNGVIHGIGKLLTVPKP